MPKDDISAKVADQARKDFGVNPLSVFPGQDVFSGFLVVLPEQVAFYKDLFGDLELRNQYPYAETSGVGLNDGFGGKEISGRYDNREMRLRRLADGDAELLLSLFEGRPPAIDLPMVEATPVAPPPVPVAAAPVATPPPAPSPRPTRPPAASPPPPRRAARDLTPAEEEWFEDTPIHDQEPAKRPGRPEGKVKAAPKAKKGAGCLAWLVIIAIAALGTWGMTTLGRRISAVENQTYDADAIRAELEASRLEAQKDVKEVRAELAQLRASLAAGEDIEPWPTAPALQPLNAGLDGEEIDQPPSQQSFAVPLGSSPVRGPDNAWITLILFCDFQSPQCASAIAMIADLKKRYGNDLRWVFKHLPSDLNDRAFPAAHAVECAREQGAGKFWRVHDHIYSHQDDLAAKPMQDIVKAAGGVALPKWKKCYNAERQADRISDDLTLAERFGADWAPALFVNGRRMLGVQSRTAIEAVIADELRVARASGVNRAQYYRKIVLGAGEPPERP